MFTLRKACWLVLVVVALLIFGALAGCGGTPSDPSDSDSNGAPDDSDDPGENDADQGEEIDFEVFYGMDWKGSETFKVEWWQKVDGEESAGWLTVNLYESDDHYVVEYHGVLGDHEHSDTVTLETEQAGFTYPVGTVVREAVNHYFWSRLWTEVSVPVLENFEGMDLNRVGDKDGVMGYEVEVVGYDTYAGQEGLTMTMKYEGDLIYEVCLSPDVAVNLYSYTYDTYNGNEYRIKLVEYTD